MKENKILISVLSPSLRPIGLDIVRKSLLLQTFKDFEWLVDINVTGKRDLNASYNRMIKIAKGELMVSLQDYILAPPDYLQKFWDAYQEHPDTFFTSPVGKTDNINFTPPAQWDWRAYKNTESMTSDCWEIDSGACPMKAIKEIGGFDEVLDEIWDSDNVNVGCRAELSGYKFMNVFNNPVMAFDHDKAEPNLARLQSNSSLNTKRMVMFRGGMKLKPLI